MKKRKKFAEILVLIMIAALVLTACGDSQGPSTPQPSPSTSNAENTEPPKEDKEDDSSLKVPTGWLNSYTKRYFESLNVTNDHFYLEYKNCSPFETFHPLVATVNNNDAFYAEQAGFEYPSGAPFYENCRLIKGSSYYQLDYGKKTYVGPYKATSEQIAEITTAGFSFVVPTASNSDYLSTEYDDEGYRIERFMVRMALLGQAEFDYYYKDGTLKQIVRKAGTPEQSVKFTIIKISGTPNNELLKIPEDFQQAS